MIARDPFTPLLERTLATIKPVAADIGRRARALLASSSEHRPHGQGDGQDGVQNDGQGDGLSELAARIAAATHCLEPRLERKHVVICAADHGVDSSDDRSMAQRSLVTMAVLRQLHDGRAAVNAIARRAGASVVIVDCGVASDEERPPDVLELRVGHGTADICHGPAMDRDAAQAAMDTGIALLLSLVDSGADCIALGQIAPGSHGVAAALIAALADMPVSMLEPKERDIASRAHRANGLNDGGLGTADAIGLLAALGGHDIGAMTGIILAAASLRIPVILDDVGTSAAALLAARLSPHVSGYLMASHVGTSVAHKQALFLLGLPALFDMGISHGEGVGAAMALSVLENAASILSRR